MSGNNRVKIDIQAKIIMLSPLHIGTGTGLVGVVDLRTIRGKDGFIYIPGSSIKGRAKMHYEDLVSRLGLTKCDPTNLCPTCRVFGTPKIEGSLVFSDAKIKSEIRDAIKKLSEEQYIQNLSPLFETEKRTQVTLSRLCRTARRGYLFTAEFGRKGLEFEFFITGYILPSKYLKHSEKEIPLEIALLIASLRLLDRIGGVKSRGAGRCLIALDKIKINGSEISIDETIASLEEIKL